MVDEYEDLYAQMGIEADLSMLRHCPATFAAWEKSSKLKSRDLDAKLRQMQIAVDEFLMELPDVVQQGQETS